MFAQLIESTRQAQNGPSAATFRATQVLALPRAEALGYDL